jgi:membrane protease YdiL (CAAX protease family)
MPPGLWTTAGLVAALAGPPLFVVVPDRLFGPFPGVGIQIVLQFLYVGLAAFVVWIVLCRERLPLRSIGVRPLGGSTLISAALLTIVLAAMPIVTAPLVEMAGPEAAQAGIERLTRVPWWFRIVLGVTGGIVEELLYRGYAIERLTMITGRRWLGAAISALVFTLAHIPAWGVAFTLAADLPFAIVMTLFYLWRRDLVANAVAHSVTLLIALLGLGSS